MNQVYISGHVAGTPVLKMEKEITPHLLFSLDVQHKTRAGQTRHEQYKCNAWNNVALRGAENLKDGQMVMIRGYLTQRMRKAGEMNLACTEVTADEFIMANIPQKKVVSDQERTAPFDPDTATTDTSCEKEASEAQAQAAEETT